MRARGGFVQVKFKTWVRTWPDWGPGPPSLRLALSPIHALSTSFPACSLSLHSGAGSGCLLGSHHKRKLYAKNALHTQCGGWAAKTAPHLCSSLVLFPTHDDRLGREWGRACLPACQYSTSRERVHSVDEKEMKGAGRPWEGPSVGGGCCVQWAIFL